MSNIKSGQKIKVFFKDGLTAQGILLSWNDNEVLLKAEDSNNILHVLSPKENLRMVIVFDKEKTIKPQQNISKSSVTEKLQSRQEIETDIKKQAASLADLKVLQIKEEKERINKKLRSFSPTVSSYGNYGKPKFIEQYSGQEKARSTLPNIEELRKLQRKKKSR